MTEETLYEKAERAMAEALEEARQGWPGLKDLPDEIQIRILARIARDDSLEKNALTLRLRSEQRLAKLRVQELSVDLDDLDL